MLVRVRIVVPNRLTERSELYRRSDRGGTNLREGAKKGKGFFQTLVDKVKVRVRGPSRFGFLRVLV